MPPDPFVVADVMTTKVVAVLPGADFKEIVAAMERWKVSAVPVVERGGRVVGVVSEADLLVKEEFHDHRLGLVEQMRRLDDTAKAGSRRAQDLMTSPAVTVPPDASLPRAARLMAAHHVKRLPVVDAAGTVRGIVSRADLLKVFLRPDDDLAAEVRSEVVDPLFPLSAGQIQVRVDAGVVTLSGEVRDRARIPLAARLARAVEGVVDVRCALTVPDHEQPQARSGVATRRRTWLHRTTAVPSGRSLVAVPGAAAPAEPPGPYRLHLFPLPIPCFEAARLASASYEEEDTDSRRPHGARDRGSSRE